MAYRYLVLDETRHYTSSDLVAKCGGTIYGVYVFDDSKVVHCCEITPSFELLFLRSEPRGLPEDDSEREAVLDSLLFCDMDSQDVVYMHAHTIKADKCQRVGCDGTEDEVIEWCRGNHTAVLPPS